MMMMATTMPLLFVLGHQTIPSSSNDNLVKTLVSCNYNDDDNNNDNEDDLIWFANNVSLALSHLCRRVCGPTNMVMIAAAAVANANS